MKLRLKPWAVAWIGMVALVVLVASVWNVLTTEAKASSKVKSYPGRIYEADIIRWIDGDTPVVDVNAF